MWFRYRIYLTFLYCPTFNDERYTLLSTSSNTDCKLLELTKTSLSQTLFYGNTFDKEKNTRLLNATIEYTGWAIKNTTKIYLMIIKKWISISS